MEETKFVKNPGNLLERLDTIISMLLNPLNKASKLELADYVMVLKEDLINGDCEINATILGDIK